MVEQIEELGPENEPKSFCDLECLVDREIEIHQVRTAQYGAPRVSEHVGVRLPGGERRLDESGLIEPAIESLVTGVAAAERRLLRHIKGEIVRIVDHVWTRIGRPGIGIIAVQLSVECLSAVDRGYSGNLPVS